MLPPINLTWFQIIIIWITVLLIILPADGTNNRGSDPGDGVTHIMWLKTPLVAIDWSGGWDAPQRPQRPKRRPRRDQLPVSASQRRSTIQRPFNDHSTTIRWPFNFNDSIEAWRPIEVHLHPITIPSASLFSLSHHVLSKFIWLNKPPLIHRDTRLSKFSSLQVL